MRHRTSSFLLPATILLTLGAGPAPSALRASQAPQAPAYVPRNASVRVDVIVTDPRGEPIPNLRKEDFELIADGVAQPIETVDFRSTLPHRGGRAAVAPRAPLDEPNDPTSGGRLIAVFLDEYHVSAGENTARVRAALRRFADEELRPDDLVAVMKPLDSIVSIRLTRNRDDIRAAIESFTGCKGDYTPRSPFEASVISRSPDAAAPARAQVVMSALHALATHVGGQHDGRKAIVFVTEGFTPARSRMRLPDLQSVVRAANRFDVAIYTFDPNGAAPPAAAPAEPGAPEAEPAVVIRTLAAQTNGEATGTADQFAPALRRVSRDLDAYYTLSFKPASANDGKFHPIAVRVRRKQAQVRSRSGYWAIAVDELRRARLTSAAPAFRPKPQRISPIVQPWFRMTRGPDGQTRILFRWEAKAASRNASKAPAAALTLSATTTDGKPLFQGRVAPAVNALDSTIPARAVVDAPPGPLAIEMSIEDIGDTVLDSDARVINVPDLNGPRTVLGAPEILRTRTALDFRTAAADLDRLPTAARVFSRGERLLIRIAGFGRSGSKATVTARLMNAIGQPMRDLPALTPPSGSTDSEFTQFDLLLAALAPGDYRIEFSANAPGDPSPTTDVLAFRVIG